MNKKRPNRIEKGKNRGKRVEFFLTMPKIVIASVAFCEILWCIMEARKIFQNHEIEENKHEGNDNMKFKKEKKIGIFTPLEVVERNGKSYALLCLQFERAIRYAIYIDDEEKVALELIGNQRREAQMLFEDVVRGELSPVHLRDVASDQRLDRETMEIFY